MGFGGGSAPSPPKVKYPRKTPEEIALTQKQLQLVDQIINQGSTTFNQGQQDREEAFRIYDRLKNPIQLGSQQEQVVNDLANQYLNLYQKGITQGQAKETFDRNRADTLAGLSARGILNSSYGQGAIADLYKEQARQLAQAADQASLYGTQTRKEFMASEENKLQNLFNTLYGGNLQQSQISNTNLGTAANAASGIADQLRQNRLDEFNVNLGNQQARYNAALQNFRNKQQSKRSIAGAVGSLVGGGLGLGFGGLTGAAVLGGLGGGIGSSFF